MRMMASVALCVRTMKGSKVVVPPLMVWIVLAAASVPHQLLVAVTTVPLLLRLLPDPEVVLPARRLKLMVRGPAAGAAPLLPVEMPPPLPVALLPVIATLVKVAEQVSVAGQLAGAKVLIYSPPPSWPATGLVPSVPATLLLITVPWSINRLD